MSQERQQSSPQECWAEFLQVISSGDRNGTIDLMTFEGYDHLRKGIDPDKEELALKQWGHAWRQWEFKWGEISKTKATAQLGPKGEGKKLSFVKVDGLWEIDLVVNNQ